MPTLPVRTRFAPSPTGFLHLGGVRTALFNWLFARHHGGSMALRIEDTDRARSSPDAEQAIIDGLRWIGLAWDGDIISQYARRQRHVEIAHELLAHNRAYYCYCSPTELEAMRQAARQAGRPMRYDGRWRDRDAADAPPDIAPVIRFKAPQNGETSFVDRVQGEIHIPNAQLDDMILLRADLSPTYMLSVVVDDHDMGITHIIRGNDHLTNAARQIGLYEAMDWDRPEFAHIPLIHGFDGAKLSKRHGALGLDAYRQAGYLPAAMLNYLARLGWGHGDAEIFSIDQAVEWFTLEAVGRAAACFDPAKLDHVNATYLRDLHHYSDAELFSVLSDFVCFRHGTDAAARLNHQAVAVTGLLGGLRPRAKTLADLYDHVAFLSARHPIQLDAAAQKLMTPAAHRHLAALGDILAVLEAWTSGTIEAAIRAYCREADCSLGAVAQPLRAALTGRAVSTGIFDVMAALEQKEVLKRLAQQ